MSPLKQSSPRLPYWNAYVGGVVLGLVLPRLRWRRKRSWNDL